MKNRGQLHADRRVLPRTRCLLANDEQSRVRLSAILSGETPSDREQAIKMAADCLTVMKRQRLNDELTELRAQMATLDGEGRAEALKKAQTLILRMQSLKQGRKE